MSVLWIILKIIIYIIICLLSLIIILTTIVLVFPVKYEIYFSKDEDISYEVKLKYLKGIIGHFLLENGVKKHQVKIIGKTVYLQQDKQHIDIQDKTTNINNDDDKINNNDDKINNKEQKSIDLKKSDDNIEKTYEQTSAYDNNNLKSNNINSKNYDDNNNINEEKINFKNKQHNKSQKYSSDKLDKLYNKDKKTKKNKKAKNKKVNLKNKLGELLEMKDIIVYILIFIKDLFLYISPKEYSFEIVVGKDDPADTAELVAKLIMMYPLYYKHGIIRGDYERVGVRGGCLLEGKFRIGGIINLVIRLLLRAPVRTLLKDILYNKEG